MRRPCNGTHDNQAQMYGNFLCDAKLLQHAHFYKRPVNAFEAPVAP